MKIAVIGPQNTGKSTFVKDFVNAFPEFKTPLETYRDVVKKNNLSINQRTGIESQRLIRDFIYEQTKVSEDGTVFDRCLIDNYIYSLYGFSRGNVSSDFLRESEGMMQESVLEIDHFFFIPTSLAVPLVEDTLRDTQVSYVDTINRMFIDTLFALVRTHAIQVSTIGGTREERIIQAREALSNSRH